MGRCCGAILPVQLRVFRVQKAAIRILSGATRRGHCDASATFINQTSCYKHRTKTKHLQIENRPFGTANVNNDNVEEIALHCVVLREPCESGIWQHRAIISRSFQAIFLICTIPYPRGLYGSALQAS